MTYPWLRPGTAHPAEPRWGHPAGLQIGLAPLPGPRGLVRIYAPHLGADRLLNFVAVEPRPVGATRRGYSELERSALDDRPGKRFWSTDGPPDGEPRDPAAPARGVVAGDDLTVHIGVERFDNGAEVHLRARFRADRPDEVAFAAWAGPGSVPLDTLTLTATMGNYARLRRLRLADRVVTPEVLWPGFAGDGFTDHARFGLASLMRDATGAAVVVATPDEADPVAATYAEGTNDGWRYQGRRAAQGWRVVDPHPDLAVLVNGRHTYWASRHPIPGGTAFENLEFSEPYRPGQEYVFTVHPM